MRLGRRSGRARAGQGRWCVRVVRGLLPDRNPLRRTSDRVQVYLLAGLFVASAAVAPFAAQAASHAAYAAALRAEQAQQAASYQVRAVLTQAASSSLSPYADVSYVPVQATWTSVTGVRHSGQVMAPAGSARGSAVTVWTDATGDLTSPPLQPSQVIGWARVAAVGAIAAIGLLYLSVVVIVRRLLYRRRMAAWEAEWEVTARLWNRQRW
jgi:hypothetical protein